MSDASDATISLPTAPKAEKRPHVYRVHGVEISDEFAWLKAANWRDVLRDGNVLPADIREVLVAENAYADAMLAHTRELQSHLLAEMRGRIKEDDVDVPSPDGPFVYYRRHREGGQHPIFCRRSRETAGDEVVLLDGDEMGRGKPFFDIGAVRHAPSHERFAWSVDEKGSELFTVRVRDIDSGVDAADEVAETSGNVVWSADSQSFFYVRLDDNHRPHRVLRHRLGEDPSRDVCVYEEQDPGWFVGIHATQSGEFLVIDLHDHDSSETHLVDLHHPESAPRLVTPRVRGLRYDVEAYGHTLFILTNANGAEDFKIVQATLEAPSIWTDLVPHRRGRMITSMFALSGHLMRLEREDGLPRIVAREIDSGDEHRIAFEEEAYSLGLDRILEFDTHVVRFSYSSMTTPREVFDYDLQTRTRVMRKQQDIPSGHDPKHYVTRRVYARADDGEMVPVSLLYRRDVALDGSAPLLLQGYGAYGHASPASFSANRLSLVDRGFVYAIAHIRGGTDKGWHWYENGKLQHKPNTFSDFIAAGRHLAREGFTSQGRIVALGGSAGGMLMGAVANMAPELFAGIIADVPFVDVMNTMLDAELPLTPPEWLEWGNPATDRQAFDTILCYSPYDNVRAQHYPAILAQAGLTDPRVTYWEPAKWVARLRDRMTGGGPILLRTNMDAGHGGAAGRFDRLKEIAIEYAFAIDCVQGRGASDMKLSRERSHLLVIDVQDKLLPAIHRGDEVAARCAVLAQAACLLDVPVTISQQYSRGLGGTLESVREAAGPQARVFDKTSFSCAGDPAIRAHLDATARTRPQIVLCGIEAHVCVAQTALDVHAMGLAVAVVTDAIGSRDPSSRDVALLRLAQAGVVPVTSEMVIFEWIGDAGTPEFKRLLPLIK